jgi:hypothetical protein
MFVEPHIIHTSFWILFILFFASTEVWAQGLALGRAGVSPYLFWEPFQEVTILIHTLHWENWSSKWSSNLSQLPRVKLRLVCVPKVDALIYLAWPRGEVIKSIRQQCPFYYDCILFLNKTIFFSLMAQASQMTKHKMFVPGALALGWLSQMQCPRSFIKSTVQWDVFRHKYSCSAEECHLQSAAPAFIRLRWHDSGQRAHTAVSPWNAALWRKADNHLLTWVFPSD